MPKRIRINLKRSEFQGDDARFRFQACYYPTFLSAWKAVLSVAMVIRDDVSGQYRANTKQGECDSPQQQGPHETLHRSSDP
jgi:hypothetical protein